MKIATKLRKSIRDNLKGPLGPTSLAFAIRQSLELIVELRQCGASWTQIVHPINVALEAESHPLISADTLRGVCARELRVKRPRSIPTLPPEKDPRTSAQSTTPDARDKKLMKRESETTGSDRLDEAAAIAAVLEQMRGI